MAAPILPNAATIVAKAIDAIVALRPESLAHFNPPAGRWADLPAMWRAQVTVLLDRLGDEISSARLKFAKGDSLTALCASEFHTRLPSQPQTASGTALLFRTGVIGTGSAASISFSGGISTITGLVGITSTNVFTSITISGSSTPGNNGTFQVASVISSTSVTIANASGANDSSGTVSWSIPTFPAGSIRAGTPFSKAAAPNAYPIPIQAAQYTVTQTVYVPSGQTTATVVLTPAGPGANANVPPFTDTLNPMTIQPSQPLFDPTFTTQNCAAAGGSSGLPDATLIAAAKAFAVGQFGPTTGALIAGLLTQQSVRHFAAFPANASLPYHQVYFADESWAGYLSPWLNLVAQSFVDNWQGFGCRVRFGAIYNTQIACNPTIVLKTSDALNQTDSIDLNVRAAARSYFDDRPDFYRYRQSSLQAILSKADPRILQCTAAPVTNAITGQAVPETTNTFQTVFQNFIIHYWLTDTACQTTYLPPS